MTNDSANSKVLAKNGRRLLDLCKGLKRWTEINSLLNENTDINLSNSLGRTPLHYAAEKACLDLMAKLIELGADIRCRENERGYTPLHFATSSGKTTAIKLLLDAGADVNSPANHAVTPLHLAARLGPTRVVKCLLREGANVNAREQVFDFTPLLTAAYNNGDEILEVLIKKGDSDPNSATNEGLTPLHIASMSGAIKSVRRLTENGANVRCRLNDSLITPLHLASMNGFFTLIAALAKFGDKTSDGNKHLLEKLVPWKYSEDADYESVVKLLIENHCDLQARDITGATPLHLAARHRSKVLKTLLKYDADVIAQDNSGRLAFHEALEHGVGLDWLLRYGADVNDIDVTHAERMEAIMKRCRFKYHLLEHFVKLQAAELPIADVYRPYVEENYYKSYLNECAREVKKMKSQEIVEGLSFYDLLHTTVSPQSTLELPYNVEFRFPKYHGLLRACLYAPLKRRQLIDSARLAWYHITDINLPAICVELIVGQLSTADLKIIVRGARRMPALKTLKTV